MFKLKIRAGFTLALVCMILTGAGAWWSAQNNAETFHWVNHTRQVINSLNEALIDVLAIQTGTRGFVISGNEEFLESYQKGASEIGDSIEKIKALTRDNPVQQRRLVVLTPLIQTKIEYENEVINLRRSGNIDQAMQRIATRDGEQIMGQVEKLIKELIIEERRLLEIRTKKAEAAASIILVSLLLVCLFSLILIILFGINARRNFENQKRAETELERFFMLSMDMLCVANTDGYFKRINPAFTTTLGWSIEEILARPFMDFVHPEDHAATLLVVEKLADGQPLQDFENRYQCSDGSWKTMVWQIIPQSDGTLYCNARDVTAAKAAQLELRRSRAVFQNLFTSLPGHFLVLTPELKIVAASDAYLEVTMTKLKEIVGRDMFEVFPDNPDDPSADGTSKLRASLKRVRETGTTDTLSIVKYDIRRPDGVYEERYWSPINSPVFGEKRQIEYIVHRAEDVTEFVRHNSQPTGGDTAMVRMEAEFFHNSQMLQATNQKLEAATKELEAFSYSVSHDLRAPLRHVQGYVQMLTKEATGQLSEKALRYLKTIAEASSEMGQLIDDLLSFSRVSRTELHLEQVDLAELVQEIIRRSEMDTIGRNIVWKVSSLPDVLGDASMLKQLFVNLIFNAIKYSGLRAAAVIEVGCAGEENGRVVFFVKDNGAGFDMQYVHKLFGVFQRLHRADEFEGTGIGLAIVQRIIVRHEGRVWAEGKVDEGATFYFTLKPFLTSSDA